MLPGPMLPADPGTNNKATNFEGLTAAMLDYSPNALRFNKLDTLSSFIFEA